MKAEFKYYVILTIDTHKDGLHNSIRAVKPDIVKKRSIWTVTETECEDDWQAAHRKYVGILDGQQLETLFEQCYFCHACDTMGALTLEFGMMDAVSFEDENFSDGYVINAYVSVIWADETEELFAKAGEGLTKEQKQAIAENEIWPEFRKRFDALRNVLETEDFEELQRPVDVNPFQLQLL